jgi:hypothetical protein
MSKTHEVKISIDSNDGKCYVKPKEVEAEKKDKILFEVENTRVRITFPEEQPLGKIKSHKPMHHRDSRTWMAKVRADAEPRMYEYTVYCDDTREYAIGGSLPKLRIRP